MDISTIEETTVEANSIEEAKEMVYNGECEWTEIKSQGGDITLVRQNKQDAKDFILYVRRISND